MHLRLFSVAAAFLLTSGCDSGGAFDISPYLGVYTGTRTITDEGRVEVEDVTFTVTADEAAGTVAFTLRSEFGGPERIDGTYDEGGVQVDVSQSVVSLRFVVDPDGDVRGTYTVADEPGDVSGRLTPSQFDLTFAPRSANPENTALTEIRTSR